jgi:hypothetical protein
MKIAATMANSRRVSHLLWGQRGREVEGPPAGAGEWSGSVTGTVSRDSANLNRKKLSPEDEEPGRSPALGEKENPEKRLRRDVEGGEKKQARRERTEKRQCRAAENAEKNYGKNG